MTLDCVEISLGRCFEAGPFNIIILLLGLLYAIGGFDGMSPLKSMEKYDPATNQWTSLPDMTSNRFGLGACACGGMDNSYCL